MTTELARWEACIPPALSRLGRVAGLLREGSRGVVQLQACGVTRHPQRHSQREGGHGMQAVVGVLEQAEAHVRIAAAAHLRWVKGKTDQYLCMYKARTT